MSEWRSDFELLREFAREGKQPAFAAVAQRHLNLVYATALRKVTDAGGAQEVAQNVFGALARKAWQFAPDDSLPAWLHRTTLLEAKTWWRGELRRRRREQIAAELGTTMKIEEAAFQSLLPLLDEALLSLREQERAALLLRYQESLPLKDVGRALGVNEDAARKRVASAVDKLSDFFKRRGFKTATAVATVAVLEHTATSASAATAQVVLNAAMQAAPSAVSGLTGLAARVMSLSQAQLAVVCAILAAVPVGWQWRQATQAREQMMAGRAQAVAGQEREEQLTEQAAQLRVEAEAVERELAVATARRESLAAAAAQIEALKSGIRGLLAGNGGWSSNLPYVRVPKAMIKDLEVQGPFGQSGALSEVAREVYGITPEEKAPVEQALGDYWRGALDLMNTRGYETNLPGANDGKLVKTVVVPPLGDDLKSLAGDTQDHLTQTLGADRTKFIFGGWETGGIQFYWPGNVWDIAGKPQTLTMWVDPQAENHNYYGVSWNSDGNGGSSTTAGDPFIIQFLPDGLKERVFSPWYEGLRDKGLTPVAKP